MIDSCLRTTTLINVRVRKSNSLVKQIILIILPAGFTFVSEADADSVFFAAQQKVVTSSQHKATRGQQSNLCPAMPSSENLNRSHRQRSNQILTSFLRSIENIHKTMTLVGIMNLYLSSWLAGRRLRRYRECKQKAWLRWCHDIVCPLEILLFGFLSFIKVWLKFRTAC